MPPVGAHASCWPPCSAARVSLLARLRRQPRRTLCSLKTPDCALPPPYAPTLHLGRRAIADISTEMAILAYEEVEEVRAQANACVWLVACAACAHMLCGARGRAAGALGGGLGWHPRVPCWLA